MEIGKSTGLNCIYSVYRDGFLQFRQKTVRGQNWKGFLLDPADQGIYLFVEVNTGYIKYLEIGGESYPLDVCIKSRHGPVGGDLNADEESDPECYPDDRERSEELFFLHIPEDKES